MGDSYELLPFATALSEAAAVPRPLHLTVTCSPRHGNDQAVEVATQLRALGHEVTTHIAARMVRGPAHLDELLGRMDAADVREVFLVGGDALEPLGPYRCGLDLLSELRAHRLAPRRVGIPGYPEGHPLISPDVLADDLRRKATGADYIVSQMCFDPARITQWIAEIRADGISLPVQIGLPGVVDRRRLLEISVRIGVGTSLSFLRKNHGAHRLVRGATSAQMLDAMRPLVGSSLGIAGLHLYTFNRLVDTLNLVDAYDGNQIGNHEQRSAGHSSALPTEE